MVPGVIVIELAKIAFDISLLRSTLNFIILALLLQLFLNNIEITDRLAFRISNSKTPIYAIIKNEFFKSFISLWGLYPKSFQIKRYIKTEIITPKITISVVIFPFNITHTKKKIKALNKSMLRNKIYLSV